jgi:hypothetical protein
LLFVEATRTGGGTLFDLLWLDGRDVSGEPLSERKRLLREAVRTNGRRGVGAGAFAPSAAAARPVTLARASAGCLEPSTAR